MPYKTLVAAIAILLAAGCSTMYYDRTGIDQETGLYATGTTVDPAAVQVRGTNVDLTKFRFVYLETRTDLWPARFEFFVRDALVRMGFKNILNTRELSKFITSNPEQLSSIHSISDFMSQQRLSNRVGPVLHVAVNIGSDRGGNRNVTLTVSDLSEGRVLLLLNHRKAVWTSFDKEAHYPVLNELKKWADACKRGTTI